MSQKRRISQKDALIDRPKVQKLNNSSIWIPKDIVEAILAFTTEFDRVQCSSVNHMWYDVVTQDKYWERACKTHWDPQTLDIMKKSKLTWYASFQEAHRQLNRPAYRYGPGRTSFFGKVYVHDKFICTAKYQPKGKISQDSCIIHDGRIYFIETGSLVCLDTDGKLVWKLNEFCGISANMGKSTELLEIIIPRRLLIANCGQRAIKAFSLDGREIWSCVVAHLVRDRHGLFRDNPAISHFVIRNGVIIFAYCIGDKQLGTNYGDLHESVYAFGISVEDGSCLWRIEVPTNDPSLGNKSLSAKHFPFVGVKQICTVGSKIAFTYDVVVENDTISSCLWMVEFVNADFSHLAIKSQTLKRIHIEGYPMDGVMMLERDGESEVICVTNREIIHLDTKCQQKVLHETGFDAMIGFNPGKGELYSYSRSIVPPECTITKDMRLMGRNSKFGRLWEIDSNRINWSELIITPRHILSLNLPSTSHHDLSMFVCETESGDYWNYPIQDFDQRHTAAIYDENHWSSRFIMGHDCGVLINQMNELHIFKDDATDLIDHTKGTNK